jgi:tellurium resistance protein TerD
MSAVILLSGDLAIDLPTQLRVGIGWQPGLLSVEPDLDISAFLLDATDRLPEGDFLVFYNQLQSPDGALHYSGDPEYIREGQQDQKTLDMDFAQLDSQVRRVLLIASLHEAEQYRHHFGLVKGAYIRLFDPLTNAEILRYTLHDDFAGETAIQFACFVRTDAGWALQALGIPQAGGLKAFLTQFH